MAILIIVKLCNSTGIKSSIATNDGNRTNLASSKIQISRSWNYWFERISNSDMAACRFLEKVEV